MARAMSARQRAALRKAQMASARKRRGTGKKKPTARKRVGNAARQVTTKRNYGPRNKGVQSIRKKRAAKAVAKNKRRHAKYQKKKVGASSRKKAILTEKQRRNTYRKGGSNQSRYRGKGAYARLNQDRYHSRGVYSKNRKGKNVNKATKAARKVGVVANHTPTNPVGVAALSAYAVSSRRNKSVKRKKRR